MPAICHYLAIDIGASSGRAVLGSLDEGRLTLREVHRFPNGPVTLGTGLHWDAMRLLDEVKRSLSIVARSGVSLNGIGIDTWGVDYGLLGESGELLGLPHHYRDPRTHGLIEEVVARVPREQVYARTGIQFAELNTLYQLRADQRSADAPLARAKSLLFMPDLLNYWLTGIARSEWSIASTSQLFDTREGTWATELIRALGLPRGIFPEVSSPGVALGPVLPAIASETGIGAVPVIAVGSHDTASAVAAVPADRAGSDWAYVCSGTWFLVGKELRAPIRTPQAMAANFTNECGVERTIRFHKNVTGLWLLQECQRHWAAQRRTYTFAQLVEMALAAAPHAAFIDPDHPSFAEFGDMPERIRTYCRSTHQPVPESDGATVRCILESLACKCEVVVDALQRLTGPVQRIHLVGGGAQNPLLCQFLANATARPVLAGPVEATAAGNIMTQAMAHGVVGSLAEIRRVLSHSMPAARHEPESASAWRAACRRFRELPLH